MNVYYEAITVAYTIGAGWSSNSCLHKEEAENHVTIQFMRLGTPICHCRPREFQERHLSSVDIGGLKESVFHDQQRIAATVKESQWSHPFPSDLLITGLPWVQPTPVEHLSHSVRPFWKALAYCSLGKETYLWANSSTIQVDNYSSQNSRSNLYIFK